MPGCWEIRQQRLVGCGILHTEHVSTAWAFGFKNLIIPGKAFGVAGMPYDMARNSICQIALSEGFEYVFHLDSDVIPPPDAILRLLDRRLPVVSGLYCRRSPPHAIPVMIKDRQWVTKFKMGSLVEVDVVGAGCLLIHRSVLEQLPPIDERRGKHWFDWRVDTKDLPWADKEMALSEDFSFNTWCKRKLGIKTFVDTSVVCRHIGGAEAGFGTFLPLNNQLVA